jgi:hypothetical protein
MKPFHYRCQQCRAEFDLYARGAEWPGVGRLPKFCSNACRQKAYRQRKRAEMVAPIS